MLKRFLSRFRELDEHEVGRPHFRLRNPIVEGVLEIITQPLYDYYEVALNTAVTAQRCFSIPIGSPYTPAGGAVLTKNRFHTNLKQAGMLSAPDKHLVRAVALAVCGDITPRDLNQFLGRTLLTFWVNDKRYLEQHAGKLPGGGGGVAFSTQTNIGVVGNGEPNARNLFTFDEDKAVQIEQQQAIAVDIDPTLPQGGAFVTDAAAAIPAGTGIRAHIYLEGDLARAVQ
jgi:hypothetical protein